MSKLTPFLFSAFILGFGILILVLLPGRRISQYMQVRTFVETQGTVTDSILQYGYLDTKRAGTRGTSKRSRAYLATATYNYIYDDTPYVSTQISKHQGKSSNEEFQRALARTLSHHRQSGKPIAVYIDPNNPSDAVLHKSFDWIGSIVGGVLGGFVTLLGLFLSFVAFKD